MSTLENSLHSMASTQNNSPFIDDDLKTPTGTAATVNNPLDSKSTPAENSNPVAANGSKNPPNAPATIETSQSAGKVAAPTNNTAPFIDDHLKTPNTAAATIADTQPDTQTAIKSENKSIQPQRDHLELLAEHARVEIEQLAVGELTLRKEMRTQTVNIPITLRQEVLIVEHHAGAPLQHVSQATDSSRLVQIEQLEQLPHTIIKLNGEPHDLDQQPLTLILSQEIAKVNVHTVVAEHIRIATEHKNFDKQLNVSLRHEELVSEQHDYETPKVLSSQHVDAEFKTIDPALAPKT